MLFLGSKLLIDLQIFSKSIHEGFPRVQNFDCIEFVGLLVLFFLL